MDRETTKPKINQVLLTESAISASIASLAEQITETYNRTDKVVAIVLLDGAKRFADALFERIDNSKFELRYLRVKSYNGMDYGNRLEINGNIGDVKDSDVLIVDDIYDSGKTLSAVLSLVKKENPKNIKTCVMLDKKTEHTNPVRIDFVAAQVPDCFVIGFGLDYNGQYRKLPFIVSLEIVSP